MMSDFMVGINGSLRDLKSLEARLNAEKYNEVVLVDTNIITQGQIEYGLPAHRIYDRAKEGVNGNSKFARRLSHLSKEQKEEAATHTFDDILNMSISASLVTNSILEWKEYDMSSILVIPDFIFQESKRVGKKFGELNRFAAGWVREINNKPEANYVKLSTIFGKNILYPNSDINYSTVRARLIDYISNMQTEQRNTLRAINFLNEELKQPKNCREYHIKGDLFDVALVCTAFNIFSNSNMSVGIISNDKDILLSRAEISKYNTASKKISIYSSDDFWNNCLSDKVAGRSLFVANDYSQVR